ncbi:MAG: CotH kinase family protein [Bacteroidales bacterium]|nr:CotH kinase family protein [Bacteroidales bacterium]
MKAKAFISAAMALLAVAACKKEQLDPLEDQPEEVVKLSGTVISTTPYTNKPENAFDGKFETSFATDGGNRTWVGLDLGENFVVTRFGFSPKRNKEKLSVLAIIEGAREADWSDAVPLAIIKEEGVAKQMTYIDINCTRGFRYLRYVGPDESGCNVAELEFYGKPGDGDDSRFTQLTNLPTVVINTENAAPIVSKEDYVTSQVYIISEGGTNILQAAGTGVRGRGNASWTFPKKPYRLKFDKKQSPLGAPASAKSWTLINNYGDKTLMRNILTFEVSRRLGMAYTPFCQPVDVVLNGEYQGCYQLCDQVEVADGRVPAKKGYLIEIDAYAYDEDVWFQSGYGIPVTIKYPKDDEITNAQREFILEFFGHLEDAVFGGNYTENGYHKYLDLDSFLKNFIIGEFCGNTDTYWSVYMYKDGSDGVLYTGPAWDYDLAFENDDRTYPINNLQGFIYETEGSVAAPEVRTLVKHLTSTDPAAKARLKELWNAAKPELADLNDYVDETALLLGESQELNFKRWPILNQKVHENPVARGSYAAEVQAVKDYIAARPARIDELLSR